MLCFFSFFIIKPRILTIDSYFFIGNPKFPKINSELTVALQCKKCGKIILIALYNDDPKLKITIQNVRISVFFFNFF